MKENIDLSISSETEVISCPICIKDETRVLFNAEDLSYHLPGVFPVRSCNKCGLVFLSPRPKVEDLPKYYPRGKYFKMPHNHIPNGDYSKKTLHHKRIWPVHLARAVNQVWYGYDFGYTGTLTYLARIFLFFFKRILILHPYFQLPSYLKRGKLLEIGFGTGGDLLNFQKLGWVTTGADIDEDCCNYARTNLNIEVVNIDREKIIVDDETFDVVYLSQTFEHLPDPKGSLLEYKRIIRENGQLIIKVPNFECNQAKRWKSSWRGLEVPRHLFFYTKDTMFKLLEKTGYSEIHILSVNLSPFDVFCASTPPTIEKNEENKNQWWNNRLIISIMHFICPIFGYGESLYITARK